MTDRFTVRTVVLGLTLAVLGGVAAMAYLAMTKTPVPDPFDRLVTFLAGALTSVLVTTRSHDEDPIPVQGVDGGPVETVDVKEAKK